MNMVETTWQTTTTLSISGARVLLREAAEICTCVRYSVRVSNLRHGSPFIHTAMLESIALFIFGIREIWRQKVADARVLE